jgi:hypothetical protein
MLAAIADRKDDAFTFFNAVLSERAGNGPDSVLEILIGHSSSLVDQRPHTRMPARIERDRFNDAWWYHRRALRPVHRSAELTRRFVDRRLP